MASLRNRPNNWSYIHHSDGKIYCIANSAEWMAIWLANGAWGLDAKIEERYVFYTRYTPLAGLMPKRRKMYDLARDMCTAGFIKAERR